MSNLRRFEQHVPKVHPDVWMDPTCLVIGDVHIGADSSVWPGAVIRGDINRVRISRETNIQDGCVLHVTHESAAKPEGRALIVGADVTGSLSPALHAAGYRELGLPDVLLPFSVPDITDLALLFSPAGDTALDAVGLAAARPAPPRSGGGRSSRRGSRRDRRQRW